MEDKFNPKEIRVIIGLGNPGKDYSKTYHNAGAMFLDALIARERKTVKFKKNLFGKFVYAKISKFILVKPISFMNESGNSIKKALSFFKCPLENALIVYDENDLMIGDWKIDFGRSAAGHKGISSIIEKLGDKKFWRLRIGIQPHGDRRKKAGDFVLSPLSSSDSESLENAFEEIAEKYFTLL